MFSQCDKPNITSVHNNRHRCGLHLIISTSVDAKGKVRGFKVALSQITQIQSVRKFFLDALFICHGRSQTCEVFHISGHRFIILEIMESYRHKRI
jgi:hypothetical protein